MPSRSLRYSGSARPAWRMNHTGVGPGCDEPGAATARSVRQAPARRRSCRRTGLHRWRRSFNDHETRGDRDDLTAERRSEAGVADTPVRRPRICRRRVRPFSLRPRSDAAPAARRRENAMWLPCPECRIESAFEQPPCTGRPWADCPEWFCVTCGSRRVRRCGPGRGWLPETADAARPAVMRPAVAKRRTSTRRARGLIDRDAAVAGFGSHRMPTSPQRRRRPPGQRGLSLARGAAVPGSATTAYGESVRSPEPRARCRSAEFTAVVDALLAAGRPAPRS